MADWKLLLLAAKTIDKDGQCIPFMVSAAKLKDIAALVEGRLYQTHISFRDCATHHRFTEVLP